MNYVFSIVFGVLGTGKDFLGDEVDLNFPLIKENPGQEFKQKHALEVKQPTCGSRQ